MNSRIPEPAHQRTFIDLFSGCGGLSLGMTDAGIRGLFAVEKAPDAFLTFKANLLDNGEDQRFVWPKWLDKKSIGIEDFLTKYGHRLEKMGGKVNVITGGPPCQGFSFAGLRNGKDPRNKLFRKYVEFVDAVRPSMLVLDRIAGSGSAFRLLLRQFLRIKFSLHLGMRNCHQPSHCSLEPRELP